MTQLGLFGPPRAPRPRPEPRVPVAARRTDPDTSHEAAAQMADSTHDDRCRDALARLGLATYREVAREAGLEPIQAQRALSRLSYETPPRARQVADYRACRTNGRRMQLWRAL